MRCLSSSFESSTVIKLDYVGPEISGCVFTVRLRRPPLSYYHAIPPLTHPMTPETEQAPEAAGHLPYGDPTRELLTKLANRLEEKRS